MLPTQYQEFIHLSRYARWNEEEARRETWDETSRRYFNFFATYLNDNHDAGLGLAEVNGLFQAVNGLQVMPSMRSLMTAGPALSRDHIAGYNCAYVPVDDVRAFDEIMFILMCATGVGFSVERQFINQLPAVPEAVTESTSVIQVRDSKRGWSEAYRELLGSLYVGRIPEWDDRKVRPAGARLKTMGGRASGPEPLRELVDFTIHTFKNAAGRKLTSVECHDVCCKIGECVVVGGVRRSALISLSNLTDHRMRDAKSGEWWVLTPHRYLSNNSVAYTETPEVGQFMEEWLSLYQSKSGERGIFNREAAIEKVKENGRRKHAYGNGEGIHPIDFGTNPCLSGDTPILTLDGYRNIVDTVGQRIHIWNGEEWSLVEPFSTGHNETVVVNLSDGTSLRCTPNHKFLTWEGWAQGGLETRVEAQDLRVGDKMTKYEMPVVDSGQTYCIEPYSQGFYAGDGNQGLTHSWVYEPKYPCIDRLVGEIKNDGDRARKVWAHGPMLDRRFVPIQGKSSYCIDWLAGLLDSDGVVTQDKNGSGFQIGSVDFDFLANVRLMLTRLGVRAKVVHGRPEGIRSLPDGRGGHAPYLCKADWRLLINNTDAASLMGMGLHLSRLNHDGSWPQRDARQFVRVVSVEDAEPCETFCFTDKIAHRGTFNGIVTGQCGEIILRPQQFCNLSTVVVRADDSESTLIDKVEKATILGTWQSTLTNFRYIRAKWKQNCEEERLLGVSMTGIMSNKLLNGRNGGGLKRTAELLQDLKQVAIETNKEWADRLGIQRSAAITCVKPEGTATQLVGADSSGIHAAFASYYLRRIRQDKKDPITQLMIDQGVPHEQDVMNPENIVFEFPSKASSDAVFRDEMNAIEQLEHWKVFRDNWCEHNPSITIHVKEHEWPEVGGWVYRHFDKATGLTFVPHSDHVYKQAPYEEIHKDGYDTRVENMPEIDWSVLGEYEKEDTTKSSHEMACVGGACEIHI